MATTVKRRATSFRLPMDLLEKLRAEAQKQHRSLNNLVEVFLLESLYREPNATTLAAMAEVKSDAHYFGKSQSWLTQRLNGSKVNI